MACPSGLVAAVENPICKCHWQFLARESERKSETEVLRNFFITDFSSEAGITVDFGCNKLAWVRIGYDWRCHSMTLVIVFGDRTQKDVFICRDSDGDGSGESQIGASN